MLTSLFGDLRATRDAKEKSKRNIELPFFEYYLKDRGATLQRMADALGGGEDET